MNLLSTLRSLAMGSGLALAILAADGWSGAGLFISDAEARIGRPMTPVSVAGVSRRTTRRTIRRTTAYAATLPRGCTTVTISGTLLHQCGATYYQSSGSKYVIVEVD